MISATPEKTLYFAYGSNMSRKRLEDRVGTVDSAAAAVLDNYRLIFNKSGGDGTSKANIQSKIGAQVQGVLYPLNQDQFAMLDMHEGAPRHYERKEVQLTDSNRKTNSAIAYIATPDYISDQFTPPSCAYLQHILNGYNEHDLKIDTLLKAADGKDFST